MTETHTFRAALRWTGNRGTGTSGYQEYGREHRLEAPDKPTIAASSAAVFRGDGGRWNPEELLVASLSSCHMLWYLHLCATRAVVVIDYRDDAEGSMEVSGDGSGRFTRVTLRPRVTIASGDVSLATTLHDQAHRRCFIANSVNFPVLHEPTVVPPPRSAAESVGEG